MTAATGLRARQAMILLGMHRRFEQSLAMLDAGRLFDWRGLERPLMESPRAGTLEGGFGLWEST